MLENDRYIAGIGQAVLELLTLSWVRESPKGNLLTSKIFQHLRYYKARSTENDITSDRSQFPNIKN